MANFPNSVHVGVTAVRTHSEEKIGDQKRSLCLLWSLYYEHWLIVAAYNWNSFQSHLSRLDHQSSKFQNFARLFSTFDSFVPTTKPLIRIKKGV